MIKEQQNTKFEEDLLINKNLFYHSKRQYIPNDSFINSFYKNDYEKNGGKYKI